MIAPSDVRYCRERSCGAKIVFARTPEGRWCPVDIAPTGNGEYVMRVEQLERPTYVLSKAEDGQQPRYTSHYRTCKRPERFTKKGL